MSNIIGVKFTHASKIYHFDGGDLAIKTGDHVIVETARGTEFGTVTGILADEEAKNNKRDLKKVLRVATDRDIARHKDNLDKAKAAMAICEEKIREHGLDMKLVDVEYTFDRSKAIFYFTANGRVDFRELVKDLAGVFKMRIELRQIGVRDEAKMMGGVGNCGRGLCCHQWMADFTPVSIKMAKTQNLSLNPTKISGICGRLMCCLQFENDVYAELGKGMPKVGERVQTPEGEAVVADVNILLDKVRCRLVETTEDEEGNTREIFANELVTYAKEDIERQRGKKQRQGQGKGAKGGKQEGKSAGGESEPREREAKNRDGEAGSGNAEEGKPQGKSGRNRRRRRRRSDKENTDRPNM